MKRSVFFYLANVVVMFVLAMPIMAIITGVADATFRDPTTPASPITAAISEQFATFYLLAWPMTALVAITHSAWLHLRTKRDRVGVGRRVLVPVVIAALLGVVLAAGQYSLGQTLLLIAEYSLLGAVYGALAAKLVPLPIASASPAE
jgi:hypothetical protein